MMQMNRMKFIFKTKNTRVEKKPRKTQIFPVYYDNQTITFTHGEHYACCFHLIDLNKHQMKTKLNLVDFTIIVVKPGLNSQ